MKIIYSENPLSTVVELEKIEEDALLIIVLNEELKHHLFKINYTLKHKNLSVKETLREIEDLSDPEYYIDNRGSPMEGLAKTLTNDYLKALRGPHVGDCVCVPCSCTKCTVEYYLGIDTLRNLDKHEASFILNAFASTHNRGIIAALDYLKNYQPRAEWDGWEVNAKRWKKEANGAYKWLKRYKKYHFPHL